MSSAIDKKGCSSKSSSFIHHFGKSENCDELSEIAGISNVVNKDDFEKGVINNLNEKIKRKEHEFYIKKVSECEASLKKHEAALMEIRKRLETLKAAPKSSATMTQIDHLQSRKATTLMQVNKAKAGLSAAKSSAQRIQNQSSEESGNKEKDLISRGLATPFETSIQRYDMAKEEMPKKTRLSLNSDFAQSLFEPTEIDENETNESKELTIPVFKQSNLKRKLQQSAVSSKKECSKSQGSRFKVKKAKLVPKLPQLKVKKELKEEITEVLRVQDEDSDYKPCESEEERSNEEKEKAPKSKGRKKSKTIKEPKATNKVVDDAIPGNYKKRMREYRQKQADMIAEGYVEPEPKIFDNVLKVPGEVWEKLYKYQKTGLKWLWQLHQNQVGGILGDEMGLGKTVQVISFLAGLRNSGARDRCQYYSYDGLGPVLVVCPATLMQQWVREFHIWLPTIRVAILHQSGSYSGSKHNLVYSVVQTCGVLITSYERVRLSVDLLLGYPWHYVVLDEGHKIRNPESAVTTSLKLLQTPHRILLSGSPVQNHLRELWSLFDFVFPGKLGTLPVFMEQFSVPILQGGYATATATQAQTAYKCACVLRDTINPYLLRRLKTDVQSHIKLPEKQDQVLFCTLTDLQVEVYKHCLDSDTIKSILHRGYEPFVGLIQLRKICNHPDLYTGGHKLMVGEATPPLTDERSFGFWKRSGKLLVVDSLLKIWKRQDRKVLLFSQSKKMLDVLERYLKMREYSYLMMHGQTTISNRQPLVKKFNEDPSIFVFLLTTRVGGLGVNLTGADRVILFDPDWNPSTDAQAQERAWRIGQNKPVTIYRLITTGTIEEKIYHRQIFKQFVSNRVLKDPHQSRFFKQNEMHELFTLRDQRAEAVRSTETSALFSGTGSEIDIRKMRDERRARRKMEKRKDEEENSPHSSSSSLVEGSKLSQSFQSVLKKFNERKRLEEGADAVPRTKSYSVDGEKVANVVKKRRVKRKKEDEKSDGDYVLSKLFSKGVNSVMRHDAIMNSATQDHVIVETEADRVAKAAVKHLRESQKYYRNPLRQAPIKRFGTKHSKRRAVAEMKKNKKDGSSSESEEESKGPNTLSNLRGDGKSKSSSSLLQAMRKRNIEDDTSSSNEDDDDDEHHLYGVDTLPQPTLESVDDKLLLERMIRYLQHTPNGSATTDELVKNFAPNVTPTQTPVFRAMLKRICTKIPSPFGGQNLWRLKAGFALPDRQK